MKRLILVTSPPASGKTYVSKALAQRLRHVVYLDKDTLIVLSRQIFEVAHEEYNRSSAFFEKNVRDYEYKAIVALAMEALAYDDIVLINAPFTREIRDVAYMDALRNQLAAKGARLTVIWVQTSPEVCRERMIARASDRDAWKIAHWDEYVATIRFDVPAELDRPDVPDDLLLFQNNTQEEFENSMQSILSTIES